MQGRGEKWEASNEAAVIGTVRKRREIENQKKKREEENMSLKNNKYARRLAAALMTGAMMVSMMGMTAMAEEPENSSIKNVPITKKVTADQNVPMPNTTFTFTIESGNTEDAATDQNGNNVPATAGDLSAVYFGTPGTHSGTVEFNSGDADSEKTTTLSFDMSKFTKPGVYRYRLTEENIGTAQVNNGITKDGTVYTIEVWVTKNGDDLKTAIVTYKDGALDKSGKISFNNQYETNALTVKKVITGNQGYGSFEFKVTINGAENEIYKLVYSDSTKEPVELESGISATGIWLADDETFTIYGLSKDDTYTVEELKANENGYKTKITVDEEAVGTPDDTEDSVGPNRMEKDTTVVFTNDKNVTTPTGVILNIAPYILMVALAGVLAFFFLRKRHYEM